MGYNSAFLGSNLVSDYTQYDNLRKDLLSGAFWDSTETYNTRVSHNGTHGLVQTTSGHLYILPADGGVIVSASTGGQFQVNDQAATGYVSLQAISGTLYGLEAGTATGSGLVSLKSPLGVAKVIKSVLGESAVQVYDATAGKYLYIYASGGVVSIKS